MVENKKVVKALEKAQALLLKGWCQYFFRSHGKKYCAVGALNKVVNGDAGDCRFSPLREDIRTLLDYTAREIAGCEIFGVNDHPDEDAAYQNVLAVYDAAIHKARAVYAEPKK